MSIIATPRIESLGQSRLQERAPGREPSVKVALINLAVTNTTTSPAIHLDAIFVDRPERIMATGTVGKSASSDDADAEIRAALEVERLAPTRAQFAEFARRYQPKEEWLDRDEIKPF